jgi:predicted  nucleic acid-binding Zn-ribbon protein
MLTYCLNKLTLHVFRAYELSHLSIWSYSLEYETTSDSYRSELSNLKSALDVVKREADSKHTKLKDQNNTIKTLQQEFEEEDAFMKSLELKVCFVNN